MKTNYKEPRDLNKKIMDDPRTVKMFDMLYECSETDMDYQNVTMIQNVFPMFFKSMYEECKNPWAELLKMIKKSCKIPDNVLSDQDIENDYKSNFG